MSDAHSWNGDELDLHAYLRRIGFEGDPAPTEATLRSLHRAHVTAIPFENLDILLGRPILLDLPALQDKLVRRRRGGYCYEHTKLFAAALERLGFTLTGLHGRVSMGSGGIRPATHALLRVTAADSDRAWLCDVGFGRGPLEPLELVDGVEAVQDGWRFRLESRTGALGAEEWTLHQYGPGGWIDRHHFTLNPQYTIDYIVGNHYVSTHPRSPFTARPYAQRFSIEHHHVLDGLTLTTTRPDGSLEERKLEPSETAEALADVFDIPLTPTEHAALPW
jgi:N-hydroxyarylamine O-acetyltransferase